MIEEEVQTMEKNNIFEVIGEVHTIEKNNITQEGSKNRILEITAKDRMEILEKDHIIDIRNTTNITTNNTTTTSTTIDTTNITTNNTTTTTTTIDSSSWLKNNMKGFFDRKDGIGEPSKKGGKKIIKDLSNEQNDSDNTRNQKKHDQYADSSFVNNTLVHLYCNRR